MVPVVTPYGLLPEVECECCEGRRTAFTSATSSHKWTKREIVDEIVYLSWELLRARWYNRGDIKRRLAHWLEKLDKYNEAKDQFKFGKE